MKLELFESIVKDQSRKCSTNSGKFYLHNLLSDVCCLKTSDGNVKRKYLINLIIYNFNENDFLHEKVVDEDIRANLFSIIAKLKEN